MDRDPRQSIGLVKMCTKTGINIPREYIQPYFIEKYEYKKIEKIVKSTRMSLLKGHPR